MLPITSGEERNSTSLCARVRGYPSMILIIYRSVLPVTECEEGVGATLCARASGPADAVDVVFGPPVAWTNTGWVEGEEGDGGCQLDS